MLFILAGCSSSSDNDNVQTFVDNLIAVSGTISNVSDVPEPGVQVEAIYVNPGDPDNSKTTTDTFGNFRLLDVEKNLAFYLRATKTTFATINSAKASLSFDVSGLEIGIPTEAEALQIITAAFAPSMPDFASNAWLVVDIVDAITDEELNGKSVSSSTTPSDEIYTLCDGSDSALNVTTDAPCVPPDERQGPMYIAYFGADAEINVTVDGVTQIAPIKVGEVTYLEFEL